MARGSVSIKVKAQFISGHNLLKCFLIEVKTSLSRSK